MSRGIISQISEEDPGYPEALEEALLNSSGVSPELFKECEGYIINDGYFSACCYNRDVLAEFPLISAEIGLDEKSAKEDKSFTDIARKYALKVIYKAAEGVQDYEIVTYCPDEEPNTFSEEEEGEGHLWEEQMYEEPETISRMDILEERFDYLHAIYGTRGVRF